MPKTSTIRKWSNKRRENTFSQRTEVETLRLLNTVSIPTQFFENRSNLTEFEKRDLARKISKMILKRLGSAEFIQRAKNHSPNAKPSDIPVRSIIESRIFESDRISSIIKR